MQLESLCKNKLVYLTCWKHKYKWIDLEIQLQLCRIKVLFSTNCTLIIAVPEVKVQGRSPLN